MSETELKLLIAKADLAKLETLPLLREPIAKARRQRTGTAYFDTPKGDLWKRGFSLRLRNIDGTLIQTIKHEGSSVIERDEWERRIDPPLPGAPIRSSAARRNATAFDLAAIEPSALDLTMIELTPLAGVIDEPMRKRLRRRFEVEVERAAFPLVTEEASIEVAIDRGEIRSGSAPGQRLRVFELELELKSGDRRAAFALARALTAQAPLHLSLISKAERGQLLAGRVWGRPMKASEPRLAHDMTSQQAFRAICRACLHDFMLNAAGLAAAPDGGDPVEIVHQGRVALRRLRAALALFKPIVGDDSFVRMNGELKWLAGVFGRARDRDVMAASAPSADPANGRAGDFFSWFEAKRLAARRAVLRAIRSKRWRTFLIDFCEWIEDGAWRRRLDERDDDMHRFIRRRLKKQRNALVKQGAGLERLTPDARHQVRIKAKKLRYMAQFFARLADVADRNHMNYLLGALEELQSALGQMHDEDARIVAAEANVMAWRKDAGDLDPAALAGAERWAAERPIDSGKLLREAIEAYAKLAKAKPF